MIDSRSNSSLDEILEVADEFIKQNGGYKKFNETFKEKTRASASIQPSRPAPTIPEKPCIGQVQVQPSTQTSDSSLSDTKKLPTEKTSDKSIDFKWPFFKTFTNQATKKKISKLEIGAPVNFHVVEHVGLDQASTMKTMIDSGSNHSLDEILEFLKLNKIRQHLRTLKILSNNREDFYQIYEFGLIMFFTSTFLLFDYLQVFLVVQLLVLLLALTYKYL